MELKIRPHDKNTFPLRGVLIRNTSVVQWVKEIQRLSLSLTEIQIYPVPDVKPDSIWGCLLVFQIPIDKSRAGRHELCQFASANLIIPEKSVLFPSVTPSEIEKLFPSTPHLMHPEFGLVELTEAVNFLELLTAPLHEAVVVTKPLPSVFAPGTIRSFQVHTIPPEEVLKNLEQNVFPKNEKMKDEPLGLWEKARLGFYKMIFTKKEGGDKTTSVEKTETGSRVANFFSKFFKSERQWDKLQQDFEDLDKRNQKQVEKLMNLLKSNPEEAIKYAIPLDEGGITRGGNASSFDLSKRWFDFSLFGGGSGTSGSGSGTINLGDHYYQLQNQYNATAEELLKKKEYQKAAFVYMKLLKNYRKAAEALESGKYYREAATVYLKHAGDKVKAAQCYEKGNMTMDAIDIYKGMYDYEKVGDLYMTIADQKEAYVYYEKVVSDYKSKYQYVKASLLYKTKMNNESAGQSLLLEGWKSSKDAVNCLTNYFSNIHDVEQLGKEINTIYSDHVGESNRESFLTVLQYEFRKKNKLNESVKEMAYEIVAAQIPVKPSIVSELKEFNPGNNELLKDTMRFKLKNK